MQQQPSVIEFHVPKAADLPAPTAANWFYFSWSSGLEVQMLVGYLDTAPYPGQPIPSGPTRKIVPHVSDRVFMSVRGFALLKAQVDETAERLQAEGVPIDTIIKELFVKALP